MRKNDVNGNSSSVHQSSHSVEHMLKFKHIETKPRSQPNWIQNGLGIKTTTSRHASPWQNWTMTFIFHYSKTMCESITIKIDVSMVVCIIRSLRNFTSRSGNSPSVTRRRVLWSALKSPKEPSGEALTGKFFVSRSGHTAVTWGAFYYA